TKMNYGLQAGACIKIPFESRLFFTPAFFYSLKGYKVTFNRFATPPDVNASDNNIRVHCFELAPLLQVDLGAAPNHFYIKAGPSMDVQLFGHEKYNLQSGGSVSRKMKFSFADYGYVSFNFLAMLGYETANGFMIYAHYSLGLSSISNADEGPEIKHRAFGISFGKYLHHGKIVLDTRNRE
ncbi:MAG TPA: porin family protein, partial [Chitinophagaceae bacterium]|nr:porin family protein [Chitinophagaceae bacterium]